jgi:RNA polymerase primary sigma factor
MEGESEGALEEALERLRDNDILLDVSDLPKVHGTGEAAVRLRREEQLVDAGTLMQSLEKTDPLRVYLEELAQIPACGDTALLAQRLLEGDKSVVEQLTALMLSRVLEEAVRMVGRGVLLQDLIQEGSLGLWEGILSYGGGDLEAHCDRYIRTAVARLVTMQARDNGVGQRLLTAMEDYRAVDDRLLSELGRNPTVEELAEALHMTMEETQTVAKMLGTARDLAKIKRQPDPEEEKAEDRQAVEDTAYFQMRQRIAELLSELDSVDAELLGLRFGLEGGKPLSPEDTGRRLGLTPEEVVAREAAALAKLRGHK